MVKDDASLGKVLLLPSAADEEPAAISKKPPSAPADDPDLRPVLPPVPVDALPDERLNAPLLIALWVEPTATVINPTSSEAAPPIAKVKELLLAPFVAVPVLTSISPESSRKS
jgi:hypothetical protein